jgi:dihydroxyacid dehydratase/phosphogluconate dehydratase
LQKEIASKTAHPRTLPKGVAAFNRMFWKYKDNAKKRARPFTLTKEEFRKLTRQKCHYCGRTATLIQCNGIDRVDNALGYSLNNCVACCKKCNYMKRVMLVNDFIKHAAQITKYMSE